MIITPLPTGKHARTRRDYMTTPTLEPGTPESLLDDQIEPFLKHLRAAGYAERTLRKKRTVAKASVRWTRRKQIAVKELDDDHIFAFAARSPRRRKAHVKFERAVMRLFFEYLRGYVGLQRPSSRDCVSHPFELAVFHMRGLGRAEDPMLPGSFRRCRPQRPWDRQARLVSFSPTLETSADPPHADGNLNRFFGSHGRSSSPCWA